MQTKIKRIAARLIDLVPPIIVGIVFAWVAGDLLGFRFTYILGLIAGVILTSVIYPWKVSPGQTPGKKIMDLEIQTAESSAPEIKTLILRELIYWITIYLVIINILVMLGTKDGKTFQDLVLKTKVRSI